MIKAIFFDYDGVLTTDKTGSLTTIRYLSSVTKVDFSRMKAVFGKYNNELTLGRTSYAQIWSNVCEELQQEIDIRLLENAFASTPMNGDMFALARRLKASYLVGIITDNKKDRINYLREHQELDALFNPIVVSAEVGGNKQSEDIFVSALSGARINAEEAVFIDNNAGNLVVPAKLGFKTVLHRDDKNDIKALNEILVTLGVDSGNA